MNYERHGYLERERRINASGGFASVFHRDYIPVTRGSQPIQFARLRLVIANPCVTGRARRHEELRHDEQSSDASALVVQFHRWAIFACFAQRMRLQIPLPLSCVDAVLRRSRLAHPPHGRAFHGSSFSAASLSRRTASQRAFQRSVGTSPGIWG